MASRISREKHIAGYLYNAGRWEATVFDHLPMFWAQGGNLVDGDGQPIFGLPPNREYMVKLMRFLRATIQTGASPSSVLANNDYQQLSSAAVSGDVAMFLGGSWQLRELEFALPPQEFAKWAIADIPEADPKTHSTGTGGWVWVTFARDPVKQKAATEFLRFVESPENVARISIPTRQLPVRKSVYRDFPVFRDDKWYALFGRMLINGRARPAVPIYPAISEQLQLAIGAVVSGAKSPEAAVDDAFKAVQTIGQRQRQRSAGERRTFDPLTWAPPIAAALVCVWLLLGAWRPERGAPADRTPHAAGTPHAANRTPHAANRTPHAALRTPHAALWLAPALVLVSVFLLYPVLDLFRLAATDARAYDNRYTYGIQTLARLAGDPEFHSMLLVTLTFVIASVIVQLGVGLGIALLIDAARRRRAKGTAVARAAIVSAWVIPGVLVGVLWRILLMENRAGIANYVLSFVHIGPLPFLSAAGAALASLIVANAWRGCAFSMILQYAGLQRIPRELHEAADLEGAGLWQRLRSIILPEIAPVLALNLALITIATLNTCDLVLPLRGGGPGPATEVVSLYMYRSAFFSLESGRAAAVAVVMLVVNIALAIAALKLVRRRADA
jgi:multiple sugar transport system permease protein